MLVAHIVLSFICAFNRIYLQHTFPNLIATVPAQPTAPAAGTLGATVTLPRPDAVTGTAALYMERLRNLTSRTSAMASTAPAVPLVIPTQDDAPPPEKELPDVRACCLFSLLFENFLAFVL